MARTFFRDWTERLPTFAGRRDSLRVAEKFVTRFTRGEKFCEVFCPGDEGRSKARARARSRERDEELSRIFLGKTRVSDPRLREMVQARHYLVWLSLRTSM
jgi:3'-phosphoadenosine 5'-phosphosulfate sulfotransferase